MENIIEGFICPQCFQVLLSSSHLLEHFEHAHSGDKLNKIKGIFSRAKWLLGQDNDANSINCDNGSLITDISHNYSFQSQEPGVTRSHTEYFKEIKDKRVDRLVIETNKRIIRLGKLVQYDPNKCSNRKDYEKSIVNWVHDSDLKVCSSCGKSFSMGRRKHHCRICGNIICSRCSNYLSYDYAAKISQNKYDEKIKFILEENLKDEKDVECMRCCQECRLFIQRKLEQIKFKNYKPPIIQIYEDINNVMETTLNMLPEYTKLATSLVLSGSKNDLLKTEELRKDILTRMERIQTLSKRISDLDDKSSAKLQSLKHSITSNISSQLQNISKHLVPIPSEMQLEELRLQRKKRMLQFDELQRKNMNAQMAVNIASKIEDRELASSLMDRNQVKLQHRRSKSSEGVLDAGWQPRGVPKAVFDQEGDPLQQQMDILKWFISEANQAGRVEEVESLKKELRMLQETDPSSHKN